MKKYYTIEDLATGVVAIKFKKDASRLNDIIKLAFPKDPIWLYNMDIKETDLMKGDGFYLESVETELEGVPCFWWANGKWVEINLPTVSEKYILLPGEKVPQKGFTWESLLEEYYESKDHGSFSEWLKRNYTCNVKKI